MRTYLAWRDFRNIRMVQIDREVHTTIDVRILFLILGDTTISVLNGSADTCVTGEGWEVMSITKRKANVIGFDDVAARTKYGLPIMSTRTVFELPHNLKLLVQVSEAVHNCTSKTTLLSSFQMRKFGCIVDDTARRHLGIDG